MVSGTNGTMQIGSRRGFPTFLSISSISQARISHIPLPVTAFLLAILLPGELTFYLGSLRLNCYRVLLILFFPVAVARLLSGRGLKLRAFDCLLIGSFAWYTLAIFLKEPFEQAVQSGGIIFLESVGAYLLGRVYIRDVHQLLATSKLFFISTLFVGALAIPESFFFQHFARNAAAALTGLPAWTPQESRMGLLRAMTVFDHPIHHGCFCMAVFGLVWFTEQNVFKRLFRASLVATAAFFSLSAGPLQGLGLIVAGITWERWTRYIPHRVWLTIGSLAAFYVLVSLVANRPPLKILVSSLVFDPGSYYYRMMIWDYGLDNVLKNPWIGVALGYWERPAWMISDSVDNFWLMMALSGGVPAVALLLLSIVTLLRAVHRSAARGKPEQPVRRRCRFAWSATVLAFCAVGLTVHYWNSLAVLFLFYLGFGAWLADVRRRTTFTPLRAKRFGSPFVATQWVARFDRKPGLNWRRKPVAKLTAIGHEVTLVI